MAGGGKGKRNKYRIIVNFAEGSHSLVHLNPEFYRLSDPGCAARIKITEQGGPVLATGEEVAAYFSGRAKLAFAGRPVTNLRMCELCLALESSEWMPQDS